MSVRFAVDDLWIGHRLRTSGPRGSSTVELRPVEFGLAAVQRSGVPRLAGAIMPGIVDRHVHLGLVNAAALADTAVVEVHDLGWMPRVARSWKINSPTGGLVKIAGAVPDRGRRLPGRPGVGSAGICARTGRTCGRRTRGRRGRRAWARPDQTGAAQRWRHCSTTRRWLR